MRSLTSLSLCGGALVALLSLGFPATTRAESRPRIGLVLSGGGARGMAHIGALQALEELHIPVEAIAGTSAGAIAGGLYASGLAPAQITAWVSDADWNYLLSDAVPRESESLRRKQRDLDMNQGFAFSVTGRAELKLPTGMTAGRNLMANLRELTFPVRHVSDFDRLPIRFRATTTDLETGELVALGDGDLVESMRASLAVPAVFTPQRIRGRLLVDGGLSANLPVQTVQEMGVDAIIAIDVGGNLRKEAQLDSAGVMADQIFSIFIRNQSRAQIARLGVGDAYLRLKIEGIGPTDFPKAATSIALGYAEVMDQRGKLERYSVEPAEWARYLSRQRVARPEQIAISFLKVQTPTGESEHRLPRPIAFETKSAARFAKVQTAVADLGPMQKYEVRDCEVIGQPGDYGLLVKARAKKGGPRYLNFGFDYAFSSADETDFDLLLALRLTELNSLGAEWTTFLSLGDANRIVSEWYQPVDWERRWFFAAQALFGSEFIDGKNADGHVMHFRQQERLIGLDVGARLGQAAEVRLGYARGDTRFSRRAGVPSDLHGASDRGFLHADLTFDTLDAPSFAQRGAYGFVSLVASREELGASDDYTRIEGQFYKPLTFGKNTIVPRVSAAVKLGSDDVPLYDHVPLGGFLNLSGLARGSLFDQNHALAELVYYRKLLDLSPALGRAIYGGFSVEAGEVWSDAGDFALGNLVYAGSVFLGADTVVGALHLGLGAAEGGHTAVYLQLGPVFRQGRHQR